MDHLSLLKLNRLSCGFVEGKETLYLRSIRQLKDTSCEEFYIMLHSFLSFSWAVLACYFIVPAS